MNTETEVSEHTEVYQGSIIRTVASRKTGYWWTVKADIGVEGASDFVYPQGFFQEACYAHAAAIKEARGGLDRLHNRM